MFQYLDELSNYDLGLSKTEWCKKITVVIDYLINNEDELKELESNGKNVPNGSEINIELKDSEIKIDYRTVVANELKIEFDVFFGVVSHSGNVTKNGVNICRS